MQEQTLAAFRISPQQRRIWLLQNDGALFTCHVAVRIEGPLDEQRLRSALAQVVARHEILRTRFFRPPGLKTPFQVIEDEMAVDWQRVHMHTLTRAEQDRDVVELFVQDGQRSIDVEAGPVLRATLLILAAQEHVLLLATSSLHADAVSLNNLLSEIAHHYDGAATNGHLPEEPLQYADFAEWQQDMLAEDNEDAQSAADYWAEHTFSDLPPLTLPFERHVDDPGAAAPQSLTWQAADLSAPADDAAAFYLACWQTLLWRFTDAAEIAVSAVVDGRTEAEMDGAIGPYARTLPVRARFGPDVALGEIVREVETALNEGMEWIEYFNGDDLPVGFRFETWPSATAAGTRFTVTYQQCRRAPFKLELVCAVTPSGLQMTLNYDPAHYDQQQAEQILHCMATLTRSATDPAVAVDALPVVGGDLYTRLIEDWNQTAAGYPQDATIQSLFEAQAARVPARTAVVDGEQSLTYAELNRQANRLAHHLRRLGVGPDVVVGLCLERSLPMVVGMMAVLKAGGAYVPLNPEHPSARLAHQLTETAAPVVLTLAEHRNALPDFAGSVLSLDADAEMWATESDINPSPVATADNLVYVIYTSGSTGTPKGVAVTQRNLANYSTYMLHRLSPPEDAGWHWGLISTFSADLGNTSLFPALLGGGALHVLDPEVATDGSRLAAYVNRHPLDVLKIVPSHLSALLAATPADKTILPRQWLILGGEAFNYALHDRLREITPAGCRILNHYGPTETTVGCLTADVADLHGSRLSATVPIGRPIANTQLYVLDERRRPVPVGVPGELYIGGDGVSRGYLNQPERTAERFVDSPFSGDPAARLYRTGDRVRRLPDGMVEFLGRVDNQVKLRGYRIELEEIESILAQHPQVTQAAVLMREEQPGHPQLVGYVAARSGEDVNVDDLRSFLQERLPAYMTPAHIVPLAVLPITPNGKVDRNALPAPETVSTERAGGFVAPRNDAETKLAQIWAQVLGREQVGIHDNFFTHLGGDSILSIQIIARANQAGLRIMPRQIFEHQTIAELAAVVGTAQVVDAEQGPVTGPTPLTPIQHWFFEQDLADAHHWNQSLLFAVRQRLDPVLLARAVHHLPVHHDALRLRFTEDESGWRQVNAAVDETSNSSFNYVDLSSLANEDVRAAVEARCADVQSSLNLSTGPLLRCVYFDLGEDRPGRLLLVIHHLVVDGVSWRILLEDLQLAYEQLHSDQAIRLPAKTTSYKAWAEKLAAHAEDASLQAEADYWLDPARNQVRSIPVDFPGGENSEASTRTVAVNFSADETKALLEEVPAAYNTQINDVLLAAVAQGLCQWTGGRSLLIDMEGHGREEIVEGVDLWRTVGWFTAHVPVLVQLRNATRPGDVLTTVKEQLRAIPNRGIGHGILRHLSQDESLVEQLRAQPQPEVTFNYFGQLDQVLPESSPFGPAQESAGPLRSPTARRGALLNVTGSIGEGRLQLVCLFSRNLHRAETIEALMASMAAALRAIIEHCRSGEAGGFTPSDFGLAQLNEEEFAHVADLLGELEDIDGLDELEDEVSS